MNPTNTFDQTVLSFDGTDQLTAIVNLLWGLKPIPFTIIAVIFVGYFFRAIPKFNNDYLWMVCGIAGAVLFPMMATHHTDETFFQHLARAVISGLVLGMGAWAIHDKVLSRVEDKIPFLKQFVSVVDKIGKKPDNKV